MCCHEIFLNMFIKLLNSLPNLQSLRMSNYPLFGRKYFSQEDRKMLKKFLKNNKILKLTLKNIEHTEELIDVLHIFPRIQYLALQRVSNDEIQMFTECILFELEEDEINRPLTLCFYGIEPEDDLLEQLQYMINCSKQHCQVYRQRERFYIQWK